MRKNKTFIRTLLFFFATAGFLFALQADAQSQGLQYTLLEKIPGVPSVGSDLKSYVEGIYRMALIIVTLSAVLMLSIGGFMYLTSAGNTSSAATAKGIIWDSIIGLAIALVAWLILNVINPDLVNVTLNGLSVTSVGMQPTGPAPTPGIGAGCSGYSVVGISSSQCNDASQKLADILACMRGHYPSAQITSISDSGGFSTCKNNYSSPPCAHSRTSCHYGGGATQTGSECQQSLAADISIRNSGGQVDLSIAQAVKSAASACGARVNDESAGAHPHIHISAPSSCCSL